MESYLQEKYRNILKVLRLLELHPKNIFDIIHYIYPQDKLNIGYNIFMKHLSNQLLVQNEESLKNEYNQLTSNETLFSEFPKVKQLMEERKQEIENYFHLKKVEKFLIEAKEVYEKNNKNTLINVSDIINYIKPVADEPAYYLQLTKDIVELILRLKNKK